MSLERLTVVHARKMAREGGHKSAPDVLLPAAFSLETCLRRLWITPSSSTTEQRVANAIGADCHVGVDAYELLLRVACGLESAIAGESDVFGQLKLAWKSFDATRSDASRALEPVMQRLFEDVKEIRAQHLSGLGATTYGSLARTLLGANAGAPTLLIGAGQMARSVLPYLPGRPLWISNRTLARATALVDGCRERASSVDIQVLPVEPQAELVAWLQATNIVVCVPADPERDAARVQAWNRRRSPDGKLLHLGILSLDGTPWASVTGITTLNDLFTRQSANQDHRQLRFERARRACRERARLRNLGGPVNLAHGWEDLSLFANIA